MSPSKLSRRAAIMSSLMAGTFALALAASPAQAATPAAGQTCPPLLSAQALAALNLKCVGNLLVPLSATIPTTPPTALPVPTTATKAPGAVAPNPLASVASGVTNTVTGLQSAATGLTAPASAANNGAVNSLLGGTLPSANPGTPAGALAGGATGGTGATTSTGSNGATTKGASPRTSASKAPTRAGSSPFGTAAFLSGASLANFAELHSSYGDLLPLADNIPSPLIASAQGTLEAVQAPLIAAGQQAASQADSGLFTRLGGKALPGLLVVIATAMVAAVGAGNLRAFQARFGAVNMVKLRDWKRTTK